MNPEECLDCSGTGGEIRLVSDETYEPLASHRCPTCGGSGNLNGSKVTDQTAERSEAPNPSGPGVVAALGEGEKEPGFVVGEKGNG